MSVKPWLAPEVDACMADAARDAAASAACEIAIDPSTDSDGDGDPANDVSKPCAGFPIGVVFWSGRACSN